MNTKIARGLVLTVVAILVIIVVMPFLRIKEYANKESVVYESLQCVVEICLVDSKVGEECQILTPKVSRVLIKVSGDNPKHTKLRVYPTEASCK